MAVDVSALRAALLQDSAFLGRLQSVMAKIAVQVFNEDPGTANHAARLAYAKKVLANLGEANRAAAYILFLDNFVGATIDIVPAGSQRFDVRISTADADADSQISTSWNNLTALFG